MRFPWLMHTETHLLNGISNIRSSEGEILQSTSKTAKIRSIMNRRTNLGKQLGISVHWGGAQLAFRHPCASQNIQHVLPLREKTVTRALNMHP
jgi:hypothetical protein